jgi:RHS repeat-associated protein
MNKLVRIYNGSNSSGILLEEQIHDTDGEKVILRKIYNSTGSVIERQYYPSENSVYIKNLTAQVNITRVYHNGNLIAENTNGVTLFTIADHKGDIVAVTNSTGSVIENTSYGPYGDVLSGGTKLRVGYEAKTYSSVLKSYDFNFRRYNPSIQLFEQPDTIIQNVYDPQGLNHYSFERNNPYGRTDPSGHILIENVLIGMAGSLFLGIALDQVFSNKPRDNSNNADESKNIDEAKSVLSSGVNEIANPKGIIKPTLIELMFSLSTIPSVGRCSSYAENDFSGNNIINDLAIRNSPRDIMFSCLPFDIDSKGRVIVTVYDVSRAIGVEQGFVKDALGNDITYSQDGKTFKETYDGKKQYVD